jgi:hypothetical protein
MNGIKFKAYVEGAGALLAICVLGYLLVMAVDVPGSLKPAMYALLGILSAYFGFSAWEHLRRSNGE